MNGAAGELFHLFNQKDLYLKTWSSSPLTCAERVPSRESGYMELRENTHCLLKFYLFIHLMSA